MKTTKVYSSIGIVYGKYWGGGKGCYAAEPLRNFDTQEALIEKAKEMLNEGSLDGGMGYEKLLAAGLGIITTETIEVNGKNYTNKEYHEEFITADGVELEDTEWEFIEECLIRM